MNTCRFLIQTVVILSIENVGNAVLEAENGSNPMEDANWIREELHRWIYGNVRAKWPSVIKLGGSPLHRLVQLFSGYQGQSHFVELAANYAKLDIEQTSSWSALDLHKLVAFYLSIRFPICLALNKIDSMSPEQRQLLPIWMSQVEALGEIAVPVCAMAESWRLQVSANNGHCAPVAVAMSSDKNELIKQGRESHEKTINIFGTDGVCGVLRAMSAAVMLRPPVICFPVSDLGTELPLGFGQQKNTLAISDNEVNIIEHKKIADSPLSDGISMAPQENIATCTNFRLIDCILLKPGSTVNDVYEALKRGELSRIRLSGDFVRAEGRSLALDSRKRQLGRDSVITEENCVIRIQTNRKSYWQSETKLKSADDHADL